LTEATLGGVIQQSAISVEARVARTDRAYLKPGF